MKRKSAILITGALALLLVAVPVLGACTSAAETITKTVSKTTTQTATVTEAEQEQTWVFRMTSGAPSALVERTVRPFADRVEKMSNGRITFELYGVGELVPGSEVLTALGTGTIQMAEYAGIYSDRPDIAAFTAWPPFAWQSAAEAWAVHDEKGLTELLREAYAEEGVYYISHFMADPTELLTSTPVETYEDLAGLTIMAYGTIGTVFEEAGAVLTDLGIEEAFLAGQTGLLDGLLWGGAADYRDMGYAEVFPYLLASPVSVIVSSFVINLELWNSLPGDLQEIITNAARSTSLESGIFYYSNEIPGRQEFTTTTFSAEDMAKLMAAGETAWEETAALSPRGAEVIQLLRDFNAEATAGQWYR